MQFARIREAVSKVPDGWIFLVLTLDRRERWKDLREAYRDISKMTRKALRLIRDGFGPRELKWVATVEQHRNGWPHLNLMLRCPRLHAQLIEEQTTLASIVENPRDAILVRGSLARRLQKAGWGSQSTAEAAASTDALAGYMTKTAGTHDRTMGEIAKLTQVPLAAPFRTRRLRAAKDFLPPRHKGTHTGTMVRRSVGPSDGAGGIVPLHRHRTLEHQTLALECCAIEEQWLGEKAGLARIGLAPPDVETLPTDAERMARIAATIAVAYRVSRETSREEV